MQLELSPLKVKKDFALFLFLLVISVAPYLPFLSGQFLHDDYQVILRNPSLGAVSSLSDAMRFQLKPSKPVTNFLLALGKLWGEGTAPHRLLSVCAHALVTLLVFFLLIRLSENKERRFVPFFSSLLFALLPIHSESMMIALFRMEIMGTLFTLLAVAIAISKRNYAVKAGACFLFIGLAGFSKETFFFLSAGATFFALRGKESFSRALGLIAAAGAFYALALAILLARDTNSLFPYSDVIGWRKLSAIQHLRLAGEAVGEGFSKIFFIAPLTSIPLIHRMPQMSLFTQVLALAIFFSGALILFSRKRYFKIGAGIMLSYAIYLFIPNLNIGSEHYWYFPAIGIVLLVVACFDELRKFHPKSLSPIICVFVFWMCGLNFSELSARLKAMRTRVAWNQAELRNHPDSFVAWNNLAVALIESGKEEDLKQAGDLLKVATALSPESPVVRATEYHYFLAQNDKTKAEESLKAFRQLLSSTPEKRARYSQYFHMPQE